MAKHFHLNLKYVSLLLITLLFAFHLHFVCLWKHIATNMMKTVE